jgi:hypothetical protein
MIESKIKSPRDMIRINAPGAIGITNVVLWVQLTKHQNTYIEDPQPYGLLKILEVAVDGTPMQAVFSVNGTSPFISVGGIGASVRDVSFRVVSRTERNRADRSWH